MGLCAGENQGISINMNEQKLIEIFRAAFAYEASDEVIKVITPKSYSRWDSVAYLSLMICLEDEFHIKLDEKIMEQCISFEETKRMIEQTIHDQTK